MTTSREKALGVFQSLPEAIQSVLKANNAFLAGGSILSGILNTEINDYDLWFPDNSKLISCFNDLAGLGADIEFNSENAWTLRLHGKFKVQCVKKYFGQPETILRGFDFKFCQIGIDCASSELIEMEMPAEAIKKKSLCTPNNINNRAHSIVSRGGVPSFSDFFMWDEARIELKTVTQDDFKGDLDLKRVAKYFQQNLIHISPDAMIRMLFDSNIRIPNWLMAKAEKLWLMDGWTKDAFGNLLPPKNTKTNNTKEAYY